MSLRDTIKKILKEEAKIPVSLKRRLNYLDDEEILSQLKKNSLSRNSSIEQNIKYGFSNVAHDIVPDDEDMDEDELMENVMKIEEYLLEKYYKIVKDYLQKVFNSKDMTPDGNRYVFWKHSEPSGGNGFSEGWDNWEEFIRHKGSWFPIDWWEVKSKLDEIPEGKEGRVIIMKPGDKDNKYGYYFSVIKKPGIIKEENNMIVLKEGLSKRIIRRVPYDEIEKEFLESFESAYDLTKKRKVLSTRFLDELIYTIISMMMDGFHWRFVSALPEDEFWYDEIRSELTNHYRDRIIQMYKEKVGFIKEENNKKSKVQTMIDDVGLGTTIKFFGGFNNFYDRVGDNVITRQNKIDFLKEYFITNREYFVAHGGNLFADYGEEPILLYEDDQIIKQIESFDEDGVFVDLYVKDEDDDSWESGENLPYEDVPDNVLDELLYFVMDAFQSDNMVI